MSTTTPPGMEPVPAPAPPASALPASAPPRRRFAGAWVLAIIAAMPGVGLVVATLAELPLAVAGRADWPGSFTQLMAFLGGLPAWPLGVLGGVALILALIGRRWVLALVSVLAIAGCIWAYQLMMSTLG